MVISETSKSTDKDIVYLSPRMAEDVWSINKRNFLRGIKDLLIKEILYEHIETNWYFININYIFNGDRLAFLKTYEIDRTDEPNIKKIPTDHPNQLTMDLY